MNTFKEIPSLPGSPEEKEWLRERVDVLSVGERYILSASLMRTPPVDCKEAINEFLSLPDYELLFPAGGYEGLGQLWRDEIGGAPDGLDVWHLGQLYEDIHPGLFIGSCYVQYPEHSPSQCYDGSNLDKLPDRGWSVRLKLSSPSNHDGVWIKLPDQPPLRGGMESEVALALRELGAKEIRECELLDARCVFPEAGDLMVRYRDDLQSLIRDSESAEKLINGQPTASHEMGGMNMM